MALKDLTDPAAVEKAVSEFAELGRDQFLAKYGFGRAHRYYLQMGAERYDAKAIIGAAHGYERPELGPLTSKDFSSSESAVKGKLESLGFQVVTNDETSDEDDDEAITGYVPPVSNPAAFVAWARQGLSPERIEVRAAAEERARDLLRKHAGHMTEEELRQLCHAFNEDMSKKKIVHARFRPAFMGATLNTLVSGLEALNRQSARLWQGDETEALAAMTEALTDPRSLPGGGRSFPSMLMYLRDPERFAVWTKSTHKGLRVLTDFDGASRKGGGEAFLAFCDAVKAFRDEYALAPQEVDLILAKAAGVADVGSTEFELSDETVAQAKALLEDPTFREKAINYQRGVSAVLWGCLGPGALESNGLTTLLPAVIAGDLDLDTVFEPSHAAEIATMLSSSGFPSAGRALFNLSGGQFGFAQYVWLPKAFEHDLADEVRSAFSDLLDEGQPLAARIDHFRDSLYGIQKQLQERGGFESNWTVMKISLSFVGSILGAMYPDKYTYYTATKMRTALEGLGATWPRGTNGQRYEQVCGLMQDLQFALQERGVEVADLIDVQSLLFEWGSPREGSDGEGATADVDEQVRSLARRINWSEPRARDLLETARKNRQLLIYGPPGTGKTWVAKALADTLAGEGEGRVELVQFHPSYAYEDFIEGIRPRLSSDDARLTYELRRGIFLRLVDRAREFPEEPFFLIVDEINRANLPRVFGELLYGLEYRGAENAISLPYSDTETFIPENLWVVGTMNTADRSVALVDAAVRRRFRHVHLVPDVEVLRSWLADRGVDHSDRAAGALTALNGEIAELLGSDVLIGHSYLMHERLSDEVFAEIWDQDIAPVLQEHLFNRPEEVDRLRSVFLT